jgi:hypothetical protein
VVRIFTGITTKTMPIRAGAIKLSLEVIKIPVEEVVR